MKTQQRIEALSKLGDDLGGYLSAPSDPRHRWLRECVDLAFVRNGWFTEREVHRALSYWSNALQTESLSGWVGAYPSPELSSQKFIALVLAGNIPLVGFHDIITVFLSGKRSLIKCSSDDNVLVPALIERLCELEPSAKACFEWSEGKFKSYDAVIATGSGNSARYFKSYFAHVPHIIRKNRTGIAILQGNESQTQLANLFSDVFSYYGLGCRNVTQLFVPVGYNSNSLFEASLGFHYVLENKKYGNNLNHQRTLLAMQQRPFLENDLFILCESSSLYSPVSVVHIAYYASAEELHEVVAKHLDDIQCVIDGVGRSFGTAQCPSLTDYADGTDTLAFALGV